MIDRRTLLTHIAAAAVLPSALSRAAQAAPREPGPRASGPKTQGEEQIAMLLYPGFTALDFVGPHHFLAGMGAQVHLVTNQPDLRPVPSDLGLAIQPTVTMADCPTHLTVLFTPGGTSGTLAAARDRATIDFMRDRASRATYVTSVCTGSLILGVAGALRGRRATSHWSVVPLLSQFGATPERHRVVRDGNVITGAGVSAGIDFGITLVEEIRGRTMAEAGVLMAEYAPEPPVTGGTLETARPEIAELLMAGLEGFVAEASTLRIRTGHSPR
ncbi:DJ-1/PfpI family protein [Cystobacter ferrugineus]|uniref:Thiamine biosynthesis protein ThiJ n=1 Tax=Cystobacter ferrugineus TaxID=83449 RepID=A0A1L9BBB3_9BACT|nr:DJ-1/PfpI family protein [Cystobacter ferrugineus]OJH39483.1 thiamine biosynthesis protein ThiJ [Cystobacter ferrugineus]